MNKIKDLLRHKSEEVWTISSTATVYEALELMAEKNIGALPVVDDGRLVGIFSERDYARKCILMGRNSKDTPVADLMSSPVETVGTDFTVEQCLAMMTDRHFRHLPVLEGDRLTGIVSIGDIGGRGDAAIVQPQQHVPSFQANPLSIRSRRHTIDPLAGAARPEVG